ncbi:MAG: gliding motility-associated protein GldE [Chitinophagaceae bacterium]
MLSIDEFKTPALDYLLVRTEHFADITPYLLNINGQGFTFLLLLLLGFVFLSFVASGAEVAFFSLQHKEVNMLKTKNDAAAKRIVTLLDEPKVLMGSLLSANITFNMAIVLIGSFLMDEFMGFEQPFFWVSLLIKVIAIGALLLLFCEVLPKAWATQNHILFAYFSSWWIDSIVYPFFKTIGRTLIAYSDAVEKRLTRYPQTSTRADELDYAIDLMSEEEATPAEKQILKGIQKFANITVRQIMKSRLDVSGLDASSNFRQVVSRVEDLHYSRLPVYRNNLDEVIGILYTKDLLPYLQEGDEFQWLSLIRTPYFVPEQKLINDLLTEFQQKKTHMAVVVDEFGGTSGIVTMEDILEEIIGDIKDEFDEDESVNKKLDEYNYIFEGRTMIHDVCKLMNLPADTFETVRGESESLAGLVLELAERLPDANEVITSGDFEFTVLETKKNRIEKIKVTIKPVNL